jgi:LemA protein
MKKTLIAVILIIAVIVLPVMVTYNQLVSLREQVDLNWSQIETQMQRRADLIPNLVNTVKGYAKHEKQIFEYVSDARAKLAGARTRSEQIMANRELDMALSRLLAIAENYPQLKADQTFID